MLSFFCVLSFSFCAGASAGTRLQSYLLLLTGSWSVLLSCYLPIWLRAMHAPIREMIITIMNMGGLSAIAVIMPPSCFWRTSGS